jgi:hypothetical protein
VSGGEPESGSPPLGSSPSAMPDVPAPQPYPTTFPPPVLTPTYPPPAPGSPDPATPASGLYRLRIGTVTSFVLMTQRRTVTHTGTFEALQAIYNKARTHNLLAGWWGIPFGLIWTPIVLNRNARAFKQLRQLAGR